MPNSLIHEKSPYLQQHAHNPVDWQAWNEASFERARQEDKPIFLSIGYSTCHWCHVMEHESFENEAIAAFLKENFISIKVDREERPDVDRLYMTFVQSATGSGGWPMTVFLTPDLKPFFGGTYFPPEDKWGRAGFSTLLARIAGSWRNDRARIDEAADNALSALHSYSKPRPAAGEVDWGNVARRGVEVLLGEYDSARGGFGDAPKFPRPVNHQLLHCFHSFNGDRTALHASAHTLRAMARGGMNDQLGGGFHRYSVDGDWVVPHFEKMLYDQAQLVESLVEAWQLTGDEEIKAAAHETLRYVTGDLRHPDGGFFAAEDADSLPSAGAPRKIEGAFYVWTKAELDALLGEDAARFEADFNIHPNGNAPREGDPHGEFDGLNIPFRSGRAELSGTVREKLLAVRNARPRPHRDEKIIVAWNGLMIGAFAGAAIAFDEPSYAVQAAGAAAFIQRELWDEAAQTLRRHWQSGASDVAGFADDYAALARGLVSLFEATGEVRWLDWALALLDTLERDFADPAGGYFGGAPDPRVLVRFKEDYDGAEPSASSIVALALIRAAWIAGREDLRERAERIFQGFASRGGLVPHALPLLCAAALLRDAAPVHVVVAGQGEAARALLAEAGRTFDPRRVLIPLAADSPLRGRLPYLAAMMAPEGGAAAYVCREFACQAPVSTVEELRAVLET